ncbi:MAG: hypothetical protein OXE76_10500 [Alphaproteobacteria bacterium]|nr:hypothetical protein [Alphaproteobacteria bacterium]
MMPARKTQIRHCDPTPRKVQKVYLTNDELRSLRITARELGLSRSHAIQRAIRAFCLDHHARKVER